MAAYGLFSSIFVVVELIMLIAGVSVWFRINATGIKKVLWLLAIFLVRLFFLFMSIEKIV